jgi:hypothetical protein
LLVTYRFQGSSTAKDGKEEDAVKKSRLTTTAAAQDGDEPSSKESGNTSDVVYSAKFVQSRRDLVKEIGWF